MPVNLKVSLGTVNYTDLLRVTACKVSSPTVIAYETYIDVPVTNYNFIIPNLDPENYIVSYYDAPTNPSVGTLVMQLIVNALTSDILYERRFYTCGGEGDYDPADGDASIIDPYLINKQVQGVFKEGFRYFEPITEFSFDSTTGEVAVLNGTTFFTDEKFIVEIKYNVQQTTGGGGSGLYSKTITITEATKTLTSSDIDARVRCLGTAPTQVITLPSLATFGADRGLYFDNSVGGQSVQVKLLLPGTDKIRYNGFMAASDLFAEFWVSKGEHLLIRKFDDNYWEVIEDYEGVHVGEKITLGYNSHPNILCEAGQLIDGDEYPRLWWWIKNVLPATHYYITDNVVNSDFIFNGFQQSRAGQFAIHSILKKLRMPYTAYMTERGLNNFITHGLPDNRRLVNYPGGFQDESIGQHTHDDIFGDTAGHAAASSSLSGVWKWLVNIVSAGSNTGKVSGGKTGGVSGLNFGNVTKNTGVIYARRI